MDLASSEMKVQGLGFRGLGFIGLRALHALGVHSDPV